MAEMELDSTNLIQKLHQVKLKTKIGGHQQSDALIPSGAFRTPPQRCG